MRDLAGRPTCRIISIGILVAIVATSSAAWGQDSKSPKEYGVNLDLEEVRAAYAVAKGEYSRFADALSDESREGLRISGLDDAPMPVLQFTANRVMAIGANGPKESELTAMLGTEPRMILWPLDDKGSAESKAGEYSLLTVKIKGKWKASKLDGQFMPWRVRTLRTQGKFQPSLPPSAYSLVIFPHLQASFYVPGLKSNSDKAYALTGDSSMEFELGDPIPIREAFAWAGAETRKRSRLDAQNHKLNEEPEKPSTDPSTLPDRNPDRPR